VKVLIVASEAVPFVKTGGLADVAGSLLKEYRKMPDIEAYLMLPLYRGVAERFDLRDKGIPLKIPMGTRYYGGRVWSHESSVYLLECAELFDRAELYGTPQGDYPDNASRFIFFSRAVLDACRALDLKPDIIHCNDWQTGLVPLYLKTRYHDDFFGGAASMLTIHNLGYQGLFGLSDFYLTGLGWEWFNPEGIEFYGKMNFLKAGIIASDFITTVSRTYAEEILTPEYGYGLDGVLRKRSKELYGVINGIDIEEWNPLTDSHIAERYDASDLSGKVLCRKRLMEECNLAAGKRESPLVALVGRLSDQKGLDIFLDAMDEIMSWGVRLVILGKGDERVQEGVTRVAGKYRGSAFVRIGYDEAFAHRVYAGSDILLMPSRYEPCGLGQMIAMRYGTVPVARKTGGLADTITDYDPLKGTGTGFLFEDYRATVLGECLKRSLCVFADKRRWKSMVAAAMKKDFSWENSARTYRELYAAAARAKRL
jgi:starch synthase